jgi:hypothetical protein
LYDGILIGNSNLDWHFEFTQSNENAEHHFDEDDILVLYPETRSKYNSLINKVLNSNTSIITSKIHIGMKMAKCFDPDGFQLLFPI